MIIKMCFRNKSSMPYSNIFFKFTIMKCKNYRIINEEDLCNCFYFNPKTDQRLLSFPWRLKEKTQMSCKVFKKVAKSLYFVSLQHFFQTFETFKNTSTSKRNVKYVMKRKRIVHQILHLFFKSINCFVSRLQK